MTSEQGAVTARAPHAGYLATAYGLSPDTIGLDHDEHGAAHIDLRAHGQISIRIQLDARACDAPEQHAADLERDRRGLLRLAAVATQLAEEIGQRQREGGAS